MVAVVFYGDEFGPPYRAYRYFSFFFTGPLLEHALKTNSFPRFHNRPEPNPMRGRETVRHRVRCVNNKQRFRSEREYLLELTRERNGLCVSVDTFAHVYNTYYTCGFMAMTTTTTVESYCRKNVE